MAGKLFIISAPSGSGKSTLVNELRKLVDGLEFSISYTTRPPRGSEINGREYHFVPRKTFEQMIADNAFLEYAQVFGNYYGTACESVAHAAASGKDLILDIDIQGAAQVMLRAPDAVTIFVAPPSPAVLESRLRHRSAAEDRSSRAITPDSVIEQRLAQSRNELQHLWKYKYVLVNDQLESAITQLRSIVFCERQACQPQDETTAAACLTSNPSTRLQHALVEFGLRLPGHSGASNLNAGQ